MVGFVLGVGVRSSADPLKRLYLFTGGVRGRTTEPTLTTPPGKKSRLRLKKPKTPEGRSPMSVYCRTNWKWPHESFLLIPIAMISSLPPSNYGPLVANKQRRLGLHQSWYTRLLSYHWPATISAEILQSSRGANGTLCRLRDAYPMINSRIAFLPRL